MTQRRVTLQVLLFLKDIQKKQQIFYLILRWAQVASIHAAQNFPKNLMTLPL